MRNMNQSTWVVGLVMMIAGCTSSQPTRDGARTAGAATTNAATASPNQPKEPSDLRPRIGCPLGVPFASVLATDTEDGIALEFYLPADHLEKLDELRARARDAASVHGPGAQLGRGHGGHHAEGGAHGLEVYQLPPLRAEAEDLPKGARITLRPVEGADLEALQTQARARAARMNESVCE